MVKREIIKIDEDKCTGCGLCVPNCHEGALQIIDGKARLISDLFCDGLGACIGHCPEDALKIEEREAEDYDEKKVMKLIVEKGPNTIKAHLAHLKEHGADKYFEEGIEYLKENNLDVPDFDETGTVDSEETSEGQMKCGCPGSMVRDLSDKKPTRGVLNTDSQDSMLTQWPVQLHLVPATAPFLENSHVLIAADCVPFATADFHSKLLHGKKLLIGCPKFDDTNYYVEKLAEMFKQNKIKSVTVAIMEVPCCSGLYAVVEDAMKKSGENIPIIKEVVNISGRIQ